ncbi:MAG: DUF5312 family protein [Treponema sp.]|nr:DUF5312 family protein [Treponema sp.]
MAEDLVDRVISFFSGDNTENMSDKDLVLRQRYKELGENKFVKFYRIKTDEADASLGQFFYSLYQLILPIRKFMKETAKVTKLRRIVLEAFMTPEIINMVKKLDPAVIDELAKTSPPDELTAQISKDIDSLNKMFDAKRVNGINRCYNLVMVIFYLSNFDYPGLIKKFDPNFSEGIFSTEPKFMNVKALLLTKEISEFLAVSLSVIADNDWKTLFRLIKICAGDDFITESQFTQIFAGLRDVLNSKILELLVQLGDKNPIWACKPRIPDEHIAEAWIETRISKAQECIDKIKTGVKNKKIGELVKEVFENIYVEETEFYNTGKGSVYKKKGLSGFVFAEGISYLMAFLKFFIEGEIHELCDILLIRGQWTDISLSKEMSEAMHQLLELSESIHKLDESLSDDGTDGSRLKAALLRFERDQAQSRYINSIINYNNDLAQEYLENAIQNSTIVYKHLKNLLDDVQKKHPEMIINWRELNLFSKEPLSQLIAKYSKKMQIFIDLMNLCVQ